MKMGGFSGVCIRNSKGWKLSAAHNHDPAGCLSIFFIYLKTWKAAITLTVGLMVLQSFTCIYIIKSPHSGLDFYI